MGELNMYRGEREGPALFPPGGTMIYLERDTLRQSVRTPCTRGGIIGQGGGKAGAAAHHESLYHLRRNGYSVYT